jgi:8-oxo-dGTP diphosphatase
MFLFIKLTVKSNPKRDPRKHIVSIVYLVEVSEDAVPIGGDDAKSAHFYNLKDILEKPDQLAFDHSEILKDLVKKKLYEVYI